MAGWFDNMSEQEQREWMEAFTKADRVWNEMKRESLDPLPTLKENMLEHQNKRQVCLM